MYFVCFFDGYGYVCVWLKGHRVVRVGFGMCVVVLVVVVVQYVVDIFRLGFAVSVFCFKGFCATFVSISDNCEQTGTQRMRV